MQVNGRLRCSVNQIVRSLRIGIRKNNEAAWWI